MVKFMVMKLFRNRHPANPKPAYLPVGGGFTLLEVMVALSLIGTALIGIYRLHSQTIAMTANARFYVTAPLLAQKKLVELEMDPPKGAATDSGSFGEEFPGYAWQVDVETVESETLGEVAEDLFKIDIAITLNDDEYIFAVSLYRYMPV